MSLGQTDLWGGHRRQTTLRYEGGGVVKKRLLTYCFVGSIFGVIDWYYLDLLANFPWGPLGEKLIIIPIIITLNFGIWLVPVLGVSIYEVYQSKSVWLSTLSGIIIWVCSILGNYTYYTALLSFWGLPPHGTYVD